MSEDLIEAARQRIARQRGRLEGWRPLIIDDVSVTAVEVLGEVRGDPAHIGLRLAVAGRTPQAFAASAERVAEILVRRRAILGVDDPFVVVSRGPLQQPTDEPSDDPLTWPWCTLTFHAPRERLPAIAGLTTDAVYGS